MWPLRNTLVVLPARGGSKRVKNKNILPVFGQPMIHWPLMTLSRLFKAENVIVSTDSNQIKAVVEEKGLKVPFLRPKSLSDDFTGTAEVVTHALNWYEANVKKKVDYVLTVYPTAVLLTERDLLKAVELIREDKSADSIMSATSFPFPIQRAIFINCNGYAQMFEPQNYSKRSQDFTFAMHDAGQFYLSHAMTVRKGLLLTNSNVRIHTLNRDRVIDIDTIEDVDLAVEKLKIFRKTEDISNWSFARQR